MNTKIVAALAVISSAFGLNAAELVNLYWRGSAGADIILASNWEKEGGGAPAKNLTDSTEGVNYRLVFDADATPDFVSDRGCYCGEILVKAGKTVTVTRNGRPTTEDVRFLLKNANDSVNCVFDIEEGAHLTLASKVGANNATGARRIYYKKGRGTLTTRGKFSNMENGYRVEGTLEVGGGTSTFFDQCDSVCEVTAGATLNILANMGTSRGGVVNLASGAVYDLGGQTEYRNAVTGVGTVRNGTLVMVLHNGPYAFAGTFSTMSGITLERNNPSRSDGATQAQHGFIVGTAETLANPGCHLTISLADNVAEADRALVNPAHCALRFAPGVGEFYCVTNDPRFIVHSTDRNPVYLADTDGQPIVLHTDVKAQGAGYIKFAGPGTLVASVTTDSTSDQFTVTNTMISAANVVFGQNASGKKVSLGNGTAANDFDFTKPASIGAQGATVIFNNAGAVDYAGTLTGTGGFVFNQGATIANVSAAGSTFSLKGDTTISGGQAELSYSPAAFTFDAANVTLTFNGGAFYGARSQSSSESMIAPLPRGLLMSGTQVASSTLTVNGGDVAIRDNFAYGPHVKNLNGGRLHLAHGQALNPTPSSIFTAAAPDTFNFNGGELVVSARDRDGAITVFPDEEKMKVTIGPNGGSLDDEHIYLDTTTFENQLLLDKPFEVVGGSAGDWTQRGYLGFGYKYPLPISGTFTGIGGSSHTPLNPPDWTASYFGSGDTVLNNHYFDIHLSLGSSARAFRPHGEGKKLTVQGAGALYLRTAASHQNATVEINDLDFALGSALFILDFDALGGDHSRVTVANAADQALLTSGRTKRPIFYVDREYNVPQPLTYGANGLAPCTPYATAFGENKILLSSIERTIAANVSEKIDMFMMKGDSAKLHIRSGASLTVGDGVNDGVLSMGHALIDGAGFLSFGNTPAYVLCACYGSSLLDEAHASIQVPIKDVTDLNVIGFPDILSKGWRGVRLGCANEMTGVTRINAAIVHAEHPNCFSTGDVYLGAGSRHGGGVRFCCEGAVWHNNVHADGIGIRPMNYNSAARKECGFSIGFSRNGELAGAVSIGRIARLTTSTNDVTGVLSGVVSGGKLEVFQSAGALRLTGANTYTNGTDVWDATLELATATAAGTGAIWLSNGTLRFVNAEPIVFSNEVSGVGEVVLADAPVTFVGASFGSLPVKTLGRGSVLKVVAAAPGGTPVDLATSTLKTVVVVDGNTVLSDDVTVDAVWGTGTISGGKVTVTGAIEPQGTLTFDETPVLAGATLTVDVRNGAVDKVVVPDDFSLTGLNLVVNQIGDLVEFRQKTFLLSAEGSLAGDFASVMLPPRKTRHYTVEVGASEATLTCQKPGLILIVK